MKRKASPSFIPSNRKGMDAGMWQSFGIGLAISVVAFVVLAILLGAFKTTSLACPSLYTYNATANNCYADANASVTTTITTAGTVTDNGLSFLGNTAGQLPTAGTILGVSLLLVIIAGIGFAGYKAYGKMR